MTLGVGSWEEIGQIPLSQIPQVYENFDQINRIQRFEKREDQVYKAMLAGAEIEMPQPWEYGVLQ